MTATPRHAPDHCLNCHAPLTGPFCAACGQRAVPANPTVRELASDAWTELTGDDGRIVETVRSLVHPGRLTREYLDGHRARYISPVRLYLTASLVYFLVAAAAPTLDTDVQRGNITAPGGFRIGVSGNASDLADPEERKRMKEDLADAPALIRPVIELALDDPAAFRRGLLETMPRVLFAMLPLFAGVVALFFRRRPFPTHLTFATHLHAFVFFALTAAEVAKFTHVTALAATVGIVAGISVVAYTLLSLRRVYQESWARTLLKWSGISLLYSLSSIPAFILIVAWATWRSS